MPALAAALRKSQALRLSPPEVPGDGPSLIAGNDDDDSDAGGWGDTDFGAAADGEGSGLAAPRKVQQITVNYARSSKQVSMVLHSEEGMGWCLDTKKS